MQGLSQLQGQNAESPETTLRFDPGDRVEDLLQSGSCSWQRAFMPCVWEQAGKGKGRIWRHLQGTVSISRVRQLPAVHIGKERAGAKQTTGGICREEEPPTPTAETGCTPASLSYTAANLEKGRQLWGAPGSTLWETLETNTDQRETPSCIHSWGCLPLLKREGHVGFNCKLFVCACT